MSHSISLQHLSWHQTRRFAAILSNLPINLTRLIITVPTEAQWGYCIHGHIARKWQSQGLCLGLPDPNLLCLSHQQPAFSAPSTCSSKPLDTQHRVDVIAEDKRADPGKGRRSRALHSKSHIRWPRGSLPSHASPGLSLHHFAGVFSAAFQCVVGRGGIQLLV